MSNETIARAIGHYERGDLGLAEQTCLIALKAEPESYEARVILGRIKRDQGRSEDALYHLCAALEIHDKSAPLHVEIGEVYGLLGRYDEAASHFYRAHFLGANVNRNLAIAHIKRKALHTAEPYLVRALEDDPNNVEILQDMSKLLHELGKHSAAYRCMERILEIDPSNAEVHSMKICQLDFLGGGA